MQSLKFDCVSKVEMHISCKGLQDKDVMSKSDPLVAVYMQQGTRWNEIGRTEVVKNCLDPVFSKAIKVDYYFEISQKLRFDVYDIDNATSRLDDDDFLGRMECTLGQIVSSAVYCAHLKLKSSKPAGTITVKAEELTGSNDLVHLTFRANKLDKKDFFGKSDPYLELCKSCVDGSFQVIHRTEVIKNNLNPQWRPFPINVQSLCNNDYNRPIKINCYDWDSDGSHDFIGEITTNLKEMTDSMQNNIEKSWPCINPKKKQKKRNYVNSGIIALSYIRLEKQHSFLDFILGGCQVNFTVGIDFTASNGDPRNPQSLHYINPYGPNEYLKAITAVGDIIQDYDTDKLFPAYGFGAMIPPKMMVSHNFALNFDESNPFCPGISGVVAAYQRCLQVVRLYGPTNAAPIINSVAGQAALSVQEGRDNEYFVLLLITDGVLSDMFQTMQAVIHASHLPMSIIIVGVGNADFSDMDTLDADDGRLKFQGTAAVRDIVQFVPFREFRNQPPAELAKCVLAEIPQQVVEYFRMKGITPKKPQTGMTSPPPPSQSQEPYPIQSSVPPYPSQAPPPPQGQAPYPSQVPSPPQGQVPYPSQAPPPPQGQVPYPNQVPPYPGQAPPPPQGQRPYPRQAPPPPQSQAPYPSQAPPPPQSQAPYPSQTPAPYPPP